MSLIINSDTVRGFYRFSNGGLYPASGAIRSGGTDIDDDDVLVLSSVDANDVEYGQRE